MFKFLMPKVQYETISMDDFYAKHEAESLNILDVRGPGEFQAGHITSAKNIPLAAIGDFNGDKDKTYYIICQSGVRTRSAAGVLAQQGYQVVAVKSGMSAWPGKVSRGR